MCEAAGRDVHLNVEVRVEGQDSPYQVAAPCWLAELTLNVNLLTMRTMMMKMMKMMMRKMMMMKMMMLNMMKVSVPKACTNTHECRKLVCKCIRICVKHFGPRISTVNNVPVV